MNDTNLPPTMSNSPFTNSSGVSFFELEWEGKYMASVFDFVLVEWCPRWTSSLNWLKVFWTKVVPLMRSSFVRKMNAASSA